MLTATAVTARPAERTNAVIAHMLAPLLVQRLTPAHLDPFEQEIGAGAIDALDASPTVCQEAIGEPGRHRRDVT